MSNPASRKSSGKAPYVPPSQRGKKQIQWKKVGERLSKVAEISKKAFESHPATLGLLIMAAAATAQAVAGPDGKSEWKINFKHHMGGLYQGAQGVTIAMAAVPIVTAVAGAITSFVPKPTSPPPGQPTI